MASVRKQILDAVATLVGAVAGYTYLRNPDREPDESELPAILQFDGDDQPIARFSGVEQDQLTVTFGLYATGTNLETALDDAYVAVAAALFADRTLGGLAMDVQRGAMTEPDFAREEGHRPYAAQGIDFRIDYQTAEGTVDQAVP